MVPLMAPDEESMLSQEGAPEASAYVVATSAPLDVAVAWYVVPTTCESGPLTVTEVGATTTVTDCTALVAEPAPFVAVT